MAPKYRLKPQIARRTTLTETEFRAIAFIATLVLAGIAIILDIKDPVVWGFLGTALGLSVGQSIKW